MAKTKAKSKKSRGLQGMIKVGKNTYLWTGKMETKRMKRNRKAQDATLINIDALKRRVSSLEVKVSALVSILGHWSSTMGKP